MKMKLIQKIASTLEARENCLKAGNKEWAEYYKEDIQKLEHYLPSGSGISSASIDIERSRKHRIVIYVDYHCMTENGYFDGWQYYKDVAVTGKLHILLKKSIKIFCRYKIILYIYINN